MMRAERADCPSCGGGDVSVFHRIAGVPVHSVLLMRTRERAISYPRSDMALAFCGSCGFIFNAAFDPSLEEYSPECEETQAFSPTFNAFHRRLAEQLIERYGLRGKEIIEIGCGRGEFLTLLCERGGNRGVGFDPAYREDRPDAGGVGDGSGGACGARFIRDVYSEQYASCPADFVCCKMTLEHIGDTAAFVAMVRRAVDPEATVFFQVPDAMRILAEVAFWDIYYEHASYFTLGSLGRLFRRCGFDVLALWKDYDGQYAMVEARPGTGARPHEAEEEVATARRAVEAFAARSAAACGGWRRFLEGLRARRETAALWGSSSKGVAFLTTLGAAGEIACVVDINPHRQGTFMAGTGHPIVAPEALREYRPAAVLIMNPVYRAEIERSLASLGFSPRVRAVSEPPEA